MSTPNRIHLKGSGVMDEAAAAGTIKPGYLIKRNSGGSVVAHSSADGAAEATFALEDALQGKTIDDNYSSGDKVMILSAAKGDEVYAWLSAGENVTQDEYLTSNGDGTLKVGTSNVVAAPAESVDNSDSAAIDVRIKVRVL